MHSQQTWTFTRLGAFLNEFKCSEGAQSDVAVVLANRCDPLCIVWQELWEDAGTLQLPVDKSSSHGKLKPSDVAGSYSTPQMSRVSLQSGCDLARADAACRVLTSVVLRLKEFELQQEAGGEH